MLRELHDRVTGYTVHLQADLDRVQTMITNVHDLSESNEPAQVHGLLLALNQRLLDDKWVQVPRQYGLADIYMLAMNRFMEFAKSDAYTILMSEDSEELTLRVKGLETPVTFRFVLGTQGGAYLVEQRTGEQVAFWLPEQRQLLFNSEALTNLLVVDLREKEASTAIRCSWYLVATWSKRWVIQLITTFWKQLIAISTNSFRATCQTACWIACSFTQRTVVIT